MKKKAFFLPALVYLIICTVLLTLPGSSFPEEDWFSKIYFDKWVHTGMFGLMVIIISWGFAKKAGNAGISRSLIIKIGVACLLYGIAMEFVQRYLVINRSFDISDILADAFGAALGVIISFRLFIKK